MNNIEQSRRNFLRTVAGTSVGLAFAGKLQGMEADTPATASSPAVKPMKKVRAAFIGVGARGSGHVELKRDDVRAGHRRHGGAAGLAGGSR